MKRLVTLPLVLAVLSMQGCFSTMGGMAIMNQTHRPTSSLGFAREAWMNEGKLFMVLEAPEDRTCLLTATLEDGHDFYQFQRASVEEHVDEDRLTELRNATGARGLSFRKSRHPSEEQVAPDEIRRDLRAISSVSRNFEEDKTLILFDAAGRRIDFVCLPKIERDAYGTALACLTIPVICAVDLVTLPIYGPLKPGDVRWSAESYGSIFSEIDLYKSVFDNRHGD